MIHGPGCPVCVTPLEQIDKALHLAARPDVIFTSFGDMLRVPGSECDLLQVRARGGQVRVVYSPLDALELARRNPDRQVVFFAVGFETTAPANAMAVWRAQRARGPELQRAGLPRDRAAGDGGDPRRRPTTGCRASWPPATSARSWAGPSTSRSPREYRVPIVVTGFEPVDILEGIYLAVRQLEEGRHEVENQYVRAVRREGTVPARTWSSRCSSWSTGKWRGIGEIPRSGLGLRRGVRRLRRRDPVRARGHRAARSRPSAARATCCAATSSPAVPRLRDPLHAGASARRADGFVRGRLRRLLQLRPVPRRRSRPERRHDQRAIWPPAWSARSR